MADVTVIGRGTRVRGRISGAVDLEIQGHVEGEVAIGGDLTLDAQGLIGANVSARRLVVRGAVRGNLTGEEAVVLEDGARVVGDVRAPRVAIAAGALVRGYVQTGGTEARAPAARTARPATAARANPVAAPRAVAPRASPPVDVRPVARPAISDGQRVNQSPPRPHVTGAIPSALAGAPPKSPTSSPSLEATPRQPPPPLVPALKKGAKGAIKKKA